MAMANMNLIICDKVIASYGMYKRWRAAAETAAQPKTYEIFKFRAYNYPYTFFVANMAVFQTFTISRPKLL